MTGAKWNGLEGRVLPPPPWAKEGLIIFRPFGGMGDFLVPECQVDSDEGGVPVMGEYQERQYDTANNDPAMASVGTAKVWVLTTGLGSVLGVYKSATIAAATHEAARKSGTKTILTEHKVRESQ